MNTLPAYEDFTLQGYECEQIYNKQAMGQLYANKNKMDKEEVRKFNKLYDRTNKKTFEGGAKMKYVRSTKVPGKLGYGRFYSEPYSGSLETLAKEIRGTLCKGLYTDIDIVNCHPVLLCQMSKRLFDEPMPQLNKYVEQRAEFFQLMKEQHNLSEDICKELIIRILYNGAIDTMADQLDMDKFSTEMELFNKIKDEVKTLTTKLIESCKHDELYKYLQKQQKNIRGSFLSHIVQKEETHCLKAMVYYLLSKGISVDVLAYDGCQTRGVDNITPEMLRECETFVKEKTGYVIALKIKPFTAMEIDNEPTAEDVAEDAYHHMKAEWEKTHFHFKNTNTVVETTKQGLFHYTWEAAKDVFNMWSLPAKGGEGKKEPFIKKWREDDTRRMVDTLVYKMPEDCKPNEASLFTGFAYQQFDQEYTNEEMEGAVEQFQDLLRCVGGDEEEVYDYLLKTFAHIIQKPFERTGICTIFSSKTQGTGKDTIMLILKYLVGRHTAHYISDDAFWSPYDTQKEGALIMYLEEAGSASNKAKFNALKARITADSQDINPKGVKAYPVPNVARYFMTTNEVNPVKMEETDRRFLIINPSERLVSAEWTKIYEKILSPAWLYAVGKYLETVNIKGWNYRKFPETAVKKAIAEISESTEKQFLKQWSPQDDKGDKASTLYEDYKSWCIENKMPYLQSARSLSMNILPYKDKLYATRTKDGYTMYKKL
jgi:hypothetical protein